MNNYENKVKNDLLLWKKKIFKSFDSVDSFIGNFQEKIRSIIPQKILKLISDAMVIAMKTFLYGNEIVSTDIFKEGTLRQRDDLAIGLKEKYSRNLALTGAVSATGGPLMSIGEMAILINMKFRFLQSIAGIYGYDCSKVSERIYILKIFQLTFSDKRERKIVLNEILNFDSEKMEELGLENIDINKIETSYRDYLDISKLAQFIPIAGIPINSAVNFSLLNKLGINGMNSYRLRYINDKM
jgi:hypothetical protein